MSKFISKHFMELRFKPNPTILDKRGKIAELLSGKPFDRWGISQNRIDFTNKDCKYILGFFSFRNLGFSCVYPQPVEYFVEEAKKFIKKAQSFYDINEIRRIGVRSIFLTEVDDFKKTMHAYRDRFLKLNDEDVKKFGGDLVDVGFPLNFSTGDSRFNIRMGPMEKKQALEQYGDEEEIPETAIFVDVDYFQSEFERGFGQRQLLQFIDEGVRKGKEINDLICKWVTKGIQD